MDDYYRVLNVAPHASARAIKAAFHARMRLVHSDITGGDDSETKRLNQAYHVLSDQDRRAGYDRDLASARAKAWALAREVARATEAREAEARADAARAAEVARAVARAAEIARAEARRRVTGGILVTVVVVVILAGLGFAGAVLLPGLAPVSSPTKTPAATDVAATSTPSSSWPPTASNIDFSRVAHAEDFAEIAATLDKYFSGINDHDAELLKSAFAPGALTDPDELIDGTSTTHNDLIRVQSITPATFDGHAGYEVRVTFRSRQDPSQGDGQACTGWSAIERLAITSTGPLMLPAIAEKTPECPS